jgi:hypothetical protein
MKVSTAQGLNIEGFSGTSITDYSSGNKNTLIYQKEGTTYTTQRSAIDITEDVSSLGLNNQARGIYYWEENSLLYIVNDDTLYKGNQSTEVAAGPHFTSGSEAVTMLETIGATPYLVILDAENDEGWYMNAAESITQFSTNFPTTLAHGGEELDGYVFVMDEDGVIYNSDVLDITFSATSFITAERENDKGVFLGKHHEHIVAFCTRSIEFFYNANNSTGSPLSRRRDVFYGVGAVSGLSIWVNGDDTYFIGSSKPGQMAVYKLSGFKLDVISNEGLNAYITENIVQSEIYFRLSGLRMMGHDIMVMTAYTLKTGEIVPSQSIGYDTVTERWLLIDTMISGYTTFPLIGFAKRTGGQNETVAARAGDGILHTGDVFSVRDDMNPVDTILGGGAVYESGIYESGIYAGDADGVEANIDVTMRTGLVDADTSGYKTLRAVNLDMESTDNAQTMTVKLSKNKTDDFGSEKTIDTSKPRKEKRINGRFTRGNFELGYSGDEQFFLKHIDADIEVGL